MESNPPSTTAGGSRPKSVLTCPTCGHESPPEGDWRERRRDTAGGPKLALVCPQCDTDITYRPIPSRRERAAQPASR